MGRYRKGAQVTIYRNITQDAEGTYHGEMSSPNGNWWNFSGSPSLMKIRHAWDFAPERVGLAIWSLSDGYGEPGFIPSQGYDWSGIRDSSPQALKDMEQVAEKWWGENFWPWQEAMCRCIPTLDEAHPACKAHGEAK